MNKQQAAETSRGKFSGTLRKQTLVSIICAVLIVFLTIGAVIVYMMDQRDLNSFEHDGVRYWVKEKKGVYVLTDDNNVTCDMVDNYYVTKDGKILINVDPDTGEYSRYAAVEGLEGTESVGNVVTQRILIFPYVSESGTQAVQVCNENGGYTLYRDLSGTFRIKGAVESTPINPNMQAALISAAGYTLAVDKVVDPIMDPSGTFSEYGLADSDTSWIITTTKGEVYKMVLGNYTPDNSKFYVQYVHCTDVELNDDGTVKSMTETPRQAVYTLSATVQVPTQTTIETVTKPYMEPVESMVTPRIVYPMTLTNYYDVKNYLIMKGDEAIIGVDYIDLIYRSFSEQSSVPFVMVLDTLKGLTPSSDKIMESLDGFYQTGFKACVKISPTDEDLVKYGIYIDPEHCFEEKDPENAKNYLYYYIKDAEDGSLLLFLDGADEPCATDADGNFVTKGGAVVSLDAETRTGTLISGEGEWFYEYNSPYTVSYSFDVDAGDGTMVSTFQCVFFSEMTASESFYAYSPTYDMLVEVEAYSFTFLHWDLYEWVESKFLSGMISYVQHIVVEGPNGEYYDFALDNTDSSQGTVKEITEKSWNDKNGDVCNKKKVDGVTGVYKKTGGRYKVAFSAWVRIGEKNSDSESKVYISFFGKPQSNADGWFEADVYLANSAELVLCDRAGSYWGVLTYSAASADMTVVCNNEKSIDVKVFRSFYQTLLYASLEDSVEMTEEEEAALLADPSNFQGRLHVKTATRDLVYEFYYLTPRKSYIRISGDGGETFVGGMYILTARAEKIVADAVRAYKGETINPTAKN